MKMLFEKLQEDAIIPKYAYKTDAGMDLFSVHEATLAPGESTTIKTGFKMQIPVGHVALIWDRCGLAAKHAVHTLAGVIDEGFTGEVGVVLRNSGSNTFFVEKHMRIAQMLIQPIVSVDIQEGKVEGGPRASNGFGSTGL